MFVKSGQNQSLSSEICPENFRKIGFILTNVFRRNLSWIFLQHSCEINRFFHEFVSENPTEFDFFSATHQRPSVLNGLRCKSSWSTCLFLSLPPLFSLTDVNNVQSWPIVIKKTECLNYIRRVKDRTKCRVIWGFNWTKPIFEGHCLLTGHYFKPCPVTLQNVILTQKVIILKQIVIKNFHAKANNFSLKM